MRGETHRTVSLNLFLISALIYCSIQPINNYLYFLIRVIAIGYLSYKFALFPDIVERLEKKQNNINRYKYYERHRTWGHSFFTFLLCVALLFFLRPFLIGFAISVTNLNKLFDIPIYIIHDIYDSLLIALFIGWFTHLICDAIHCGGIPMLYPLVKSRTPFPKLVKKYEENQNEITLCNKANLINYIFSVILILIIIYPFIPVLVKFEIHHLIECISKYFINIKIICTKYMLF